MTDPTFRRATEISNEIGERIVALAGFSMLTVKEPFRSDRSWN
ncbi:hypothetical protein N9L47_13130 [Rhodobacteraceae bacterium]|nr:hypothetical protein [Paracoccaceae bacterium]